jgi:hypothetical protein
MSSDVVVVFLFALFTPRRFSIAPPPDEEDECKEEEDISPRVVNVEFRHVFSALN